MTRLTANGRWALGLVCAWLAAGPVLASERSVVIEVRDEQGQAVAGARVLVACAEKDMSALTDARGELRLTTSSGSVEVLASKEGREGSAKGAESRIVVRLAGGGR